MSTSGLHLHEVQDFRRPGQPGRSKAEGNEISETKILNNLLNICVTVNLLMNTGTLLVCRHCHLHNCRDLKVQKRNLALFRQDFKRQNCMILLLEIFIILGA